ncbi:MAG: hypothetical protein M0T73_07175 [Deltaproteobacteria bacterium]|nr:hypothetical protein [Deltaproteobacteria bacterium]
MKLHGLDKPSQLAKKAEMRRQTIETAYSRNSMNAKTAEKLGQKLNINPGWILFGTDPFLSPTVPRLGPKLALADVCKESTDAEYSAQSPEQLSSLELYAYIRKAKSRLSADGSIETAEGFDPGRFGFLRSWLNQKATAVNDDTLFLIDVEGDSMLDNFISGDMVLVDRGRNELRNEGVFAIGEGDWIDIKRLRRQDDTIHIISDNKNRSLYPIRIVPEELVRIIGRVIWVAREVP